MIREGHLGRRAFVETARGKGSYHVRDEWLGETKEIVRTVTTALQNQEKK